MLEEAGLPCFTFTFHDPESRVLQLRWDNGFSVHLDLRRRHTEPIEESERAGILGPDHEVTDVTVPGSADDPRIDTSIPGVRIHRVPPLHPDDLTVYKGIPVTSLSRTLIDCAEVVPVDELREMFARAQAQGLLDPEAMRASRARVEWRPSLKMLDEVIEEFCG